jgi:hypothetical protein
MCIDEQQGGAEQYGNSAKRHRMCCIIRKTKCDRKNVIDARASWGNSKCFMISKNFMIFERLLAFVSKLECCTFQHVMLAAQRKRPATKPYQQIAENRDCTVYIGNLNKRLTEYILMKALG